jgi:hypothetical protein
MVESSDVSIVVDAQDCPPLPGLYGIVKLLGMILSPGNSRHFPDAIATDSTLRRPALSQ